MNDNKSDKALFEAARYNLNEVHGDGNIDAVSDALSTQRQDFDIALLNKVPGVKACGCLLDGEPYCADSLEAFVTAYEASRDVKPVISWIDDETEFMSLTKIDTELKMSEICERLPAAFEALAAELGIAVEDGPSL